MTDSALILGLSWIDLAIAGGSLLIALIGWRMGILRSAVALLAIVVGVVLAGMYHERVIVDLAISEAPSGAMRLASFAVILGLVIVGGAVVGSVLRGVASVLLLGWADSASGAVFGVLFGLVLAQAVIAIVVLAGLDDARGAIGESVLGWRMLENVPIVRALLPAEFDLAIQQFVAEVGELRSSADGVTGVGG